MEQITRLCGSKLEHVYKAQKITGALTKSSYCCFRSDSTLATGGFGTAVNVWSLETGLQLSSVSPSVKRPYSCSDPSGELMAAWGGGNGAGQAALDVIDVATQKSQKLLGGHSCAIKCCTISADRQRIITGDENGNVVLWDISSLFKPSADYTSQPLGQHRDKVKCCCFSQDGLLAATGSKDKSLIIWDMTDKRAAAEVYSTSAVLSCSFSLAGDQLVCGNSTGAVRIHDVPKAIQHTAEAAEAAAHELQQAAGSHDPHITLPQPPTIATSAAGSKPGSPRLQAAWSPRHQHRPQSPLGSIASPGKVSHVPSLFRTASGAAQHAAAPAPQQLTQAALAAAAIAGTAPLMSHAPSARAPSYLSRSSSHVAFSTASNVQQHRNHPDQQAHVTILPDAHKACKVRCCTFSPSGSQLLSGGADGTLIVWSLSGASPSVAAAIKEHSKPVRACTFLPYGDADQLVSCAEDGIVMIQACAVIRQEQAIRFPAKLGSSVASEGSHMRFGIGRSPTDRILDCRWLGEGQRDVGLCVQASGQVGVATPLLPGAACAA